MEASSGEIPFETHKKRPGNIRRASVFLTASNWY
jgi:hypothetical protein